MLTFHFTLIVDGPDLQDQSLIDSLFEAGCDDAAIGCSDGVQYVDFDRDAENLNDAILSAVDDLEKLDGVKVIRIADAGLTSLADIAVRVGRTRESVRLLASGARGPGGFPKPVTDPRSRYRLWRWTEVAHWFKEHQGESPAVAEDELTAACNAALEFRHHRSQLAPSHPISLRELVAMPARTLTDEHRAKIGRLLIERVSQESLLAERILAPIGETAATLPCVGLTGFLAAQGCMYRGELMVVGRAANGWEVCGYPYGVHPEELTDPTLRIKFAQAVQESVGGEHPMAWVREQWGLGASYNTRRSAFWRVIRRVTEGLNIAGKDAENWPCHLVWSNLYKVSPSDGGNPSGQLCNRQFAGCSDLFQLELNTYRPKRLLLLTGSNWADGFLPDLDEQESPLHYVEYVERAGCLARSEGYQTHVVVACHPQGKDEDKWTREVLCAFD